MGFLTQLEIVEIFPPEKYSNEFIVSLRKVINSRLSVEEVAKKYEGKIIRQPSANRGKDDGWYLVKNGKKSWIVDGSWLERNGYKASDVMQIESVEFNSIEEDPQPLR